MKIIFLNTWYGKVSEPLTTFLERQSQDTDVFCFQEASDPVTSIADAALPGYQKVIARKRVTDEDNFFQATYVRKTVSIMGAESILADETKIGLDVAVKVPFDGRSLYISNFHGMSRPVDKLDDPGRLRQSRMLIDALRGKTESRIIGGDFNAFPETDSITMFGKNGYRDLIREFQIPTTRNKFAWQEYPVKHYFSDYAFISPDLKVKAFSVPSVEISDHLPLILEVSEQYHHVP